MKGFCNERKKYLNFKNLPRKETFIDFGLVGQASATLKFKWIN